MTVNKYHNIAFGCTEDQMDIAIQEDKTGWLESDYQEARRLLQKLEMHSTGLFDDFIRKLKGVQGLDKLGIRTRCRLIYFLLSTYVDWRSTKFSRVQIKDSFSTLIFEKLHKKCPTVEVDFQSIVDSLLAFSPSKHQVSSWGEAFGHGLKHPRLPDEVKSEIVHGAGSAKKRGRRSRC